VCQIGWCAAVGGRCKKVQLPTPTPTQFPTIAPTVTFEHEPTRVPTHAPTRKPKVEFGLTLNQVPFGDWNGAVADSEGRRVAMLRVTFYNPEKDASSRSDNAVGLPSGSRSRSLRSLFASSNDFQMHKTPSTLPVPNPTPPAVTPTPTTDDQPLATPGQGPVTTPAPTPVHRARRSSFLRFQFRLPSDATEGGSEFQFVCPRLSYSLSGSRLHLLEDECVRTGLARLRSGWLGMRLKEITYDETRGKGNEALSVTFAEVSHKNEPAKAPVDVPAKFLSRMIIEPVALLRTAGVSPALGDDFVSDSDGSNISCPTKDQNGNHMNCAFPFTFKGKIYTACTIDDAPDGKPWCSTMTSVTNNHVTGGGHWGHCNMQQSACSGLSGSVLDRPAWKGADVDSKQQDISREAETVKVPECMAECKGVNILDISDDVSSYDIKCGAFATVTKKGNWAYQLVTQHAKLWPTRSSSHTWNSNFEEWSKQKKNHRNLRKTKATKTCTSTCTVKHVADFLKTTKGKCRNTPY